MKATPTAGPAERSLPPAPEENGGARARRAHDPGDRLHVSAVLLGLIDARASHVDFLDTSGGLELRRWYERHHHRRPGPARHA